MDRLPYVTVDVFTDTRFGGNPLAVILDARGLDNATMQRIAAEFNYSESTFVLPPDDPANSARVRIFTPTAELPFAGHPNVGTGFVLAREGNALGRPVGDALRFEEAAGPVNIEVLRDATAVIGARIRAPRTPEFGPELEGHAVAACASLPAADLRTDRHDPLLASVGLPFVVAEAASLEALGRAAPNAAAVAAANRALSQPDDAFALFLYVRTGEDPLRVRARMFAPVAGISEDPATGSAAAALGALLASLGSQQGGAVEIVVEQGVEMGRPSRIDVRAELAAGVVRSVSIAGRCVEVMRGALDASGS
jgi:trans-2,3-dihydro-3-hydroxyanthranilate isomerase